MFRKLYPRTKICGNLVLEVPYDLILEVHYWVRDKKVVSYTGRELPHYFNSYTSRELPHYFNILQLNAPNSLNENKEWN